MMTVARSTPRIGRWTSRAWVVASAGSGFGVLVALSPSATAAIVPFATSILLLLALIRWLGEADLGDRARTTAWTLGAFGMHFGIGLIIWRNPSLTETFGGDALTYHTGAVGVLQHWTQNSPLPVLPSGKTGFFYLLAGLYWIFGIHATSGLILDAAMAAAVIPLMQDGTRRLFGREAARSIPVLCTLLPGFLLWGSQLLREAGVYFFLAVAFDAAVHLRERVTIGGFLTFAVSAGLLVAWRADVGLLAIGGVGLGIALGRERGGTFAAASALALVAALVFGIGLGYSGYHLILHTNLATINDIRLGSSQDAASGFLATADVSTPAHAVGYLPLGTTYLALGPFPWQIHGGRQLFAVPDSFAWWYLLPSLWRGLRESRNRTSGGLMLTILPAALLTGALALIVGNFGTTVRERMQIVLLVLPLICLGWSIRGGRDPLAPARGPVTAQRPARLMRTIMRPLSADVNGGSLPPER